MRVTRRNGLWICKFTAANSRRLWAGGSLCVLMGDVLREKGWLRTNWHLWHGVYRAAHRGAGDGGARSGLGASKFATVIVDLDLRSWALPFAVHGGGPLLSKPGFHFRIGPINIGWSKL